MIIMLANISKKTSVVLILLIAIALSFGYAQYKSDTFASYRMLIKKPLSIKKRDLVHYAEEEALIREQLAFNLTHKERVILGGIHWLLDFIDKDKNFDSVFPDFMLLMQVLSHSGDRQHQQQIVLSVILKSFERAKNKLSFLFDSDQDSQFEFIRMLYMLVPYPALKDHYFRFYQEHFKNSLQKPYNVDSVSFADALKDNNFQVIFAYLVQTSFLHYYLEKDYNQKALLPPDDFPRLLNALQNFYVQNDLSVNSRAFRELGYLMTHVPLVLTNYGEFPIKEDINKQKAERYIEETLDKVRNQLGDFDLLAEYVQCLKIFNPHGNAKIRAMEQFIYELQRSDGSWGRTIDFSTNAYTAIHPTGAALMAINQGNADLTASKDDIPGYR
jgi:hypothetical protein